MKNQGEGNLFKEIVEQKSNKEKFVNRYNSLRKFIDSMENDLAKFYKLNMIYNLDKITIYLKELKTG